MGIREQLERRTEDLVRRLISELPDGLRPPAEKEDGAVFGEEVRITYLHESGRCLGLGEAGLEARGLL